MNKNTLQTIAKALLLALVLALIFWLGKRFQSFDWDENQSSPKCTEPFGVALYDSIVGEALGQKVVQSYGLPKKVKHSESAFLIGKNAYGYWLEEWDTYRNLAEKGAVVVILIDVNNNAIDVEADTVAEADTVVVADTISADAASAVCKQENDSIYEVSFRSVDFHSVTAYKNATAAEVQTYDRTVTFGNGQKTKLRSFLCQSSIEYYDKSNKPICVVSDTLTTACLREYPNGGKLIVTTMPLVFTNYGVMDSDARKLSEYMSSFFKGRKLYRLHEEKNKKDVMKEEEDGDFKYIMSQPPLKWAFYIILGLLVVYMVFNSRRRMKAIPVHKIDEDTTLQFAKVLGTFYYHQEYHVPFLMKKYDKLKSTLQSRYGWDVDKMEASDLINRLYVITGIKKERIAKLFILIREYSQDARTISAKKDIIEYIEIIKEIEKNLD